MPKSREEREIERLQRAEKQLREHMERRREQMEQQFARQRERMDRAIEMKRKKLELKEEFRGLRERKKFEMQEAIVNAAMKLFTDRGFDDVTVAEIARKVGVSEQTIFNYFPSKDMLVFFGGEERTLHLIDAIRDLPEGASIVAPFRTWTIQQLNDLAGGDAQRNLDVPRLAWESPTLRTRLMEAWLMQADYIAEAMAEKMGRPTGDPVVRTITLSLLWTHRTFFQDAVGALLQGEDPKKLAERFRPQVEEAFDLLERGLGSLSST